jgi:hypothetical protein
VKADPFWTIMAIVCGLIAISTPFWWLNFVALMAAAYYWRMANE